MRLTPRLRWISFLPALAALVALVPLLWIFVSGLLERSAGKHLKEVLPVLSRLVGPRLDGDPRELNAWIREIRAGSALRVTVIREDGLVLADSSRTWEEVLAMDNHAARPEVAAAFASGAGTAVRHSATLDQDFVYAARLVRDAAARPYVLRVAEPLTELGVLNDRLLRLLALSVLAAAVAVTLVSWWLDRRFLRPLARLVRSSDRLARGDLEHRVAEPAEAELAALASSLNRLSARVRRQIEAVEAERSHLEVVGASLPEGILVTDAEGRAELANRAFRDLFGLRGPVGGRTILELTRLPRFDDALRATLADGGERSLELRPPDTPSRLLEVTVGALRDRTGAVAAARDVSEQARLAEVRRDLVANVAHELKTPLTAIRGFAETLRDGALDDREAAASFVGEILAQCRRLEALLSDLLTLSSLERPEVPFEPRPTSLGRVVEETVAALAPLARERGVEIRCELADLPEIPGETEALLKLCSNLIDNAIRHGGGGGEVRVRLERRDREAALEVVDDGPGIPEAALPRIFERFYRVDRGRSRDEGGTGLGLAIVKHAAQRHGGRVEVESRAGEGATFRVLLPL